jgi:hypothetical protein
LNALEAAGSPRKSGFALDVLGVIFDAFVFERHVIPNSVDEAVFAPAAEWE